jgi:2-polyprenyl-6-methoxyphenol hydroxylase-like FAD-dependent oxidoreductase
MSAAVDETDVLVVGAGPVGLACAVELARRGVACRVVDRRAAPRPGTRACTVWQRTLELFDLMGLPVGAYQGDGVSFDRRVYHVFGRDTVDLDVSEADAAYPLPLLIGQPETERLLTGALAELGGHVERGLAATSAGQVAPDTAVVTLTAADGSTRRIRARWVVIAQGSHANLREQLGFGWRAKAFPGTQLVQVDARCAPALGGAAAGHLYFGPLGTLGSLPLPDGRRRLFMSTTDPDPSRVDDPSVDELRELFRAASGVRTLSLHDARFNWRIRLHNSIAGRMRAGRFLLAGDAARTVMPVSAQGMNTGIQDAVNLGWKLAAVVREGAPERLIDTYAAERMPVSQRLLEHTERSYWGGHHEPPDPDLVVAGIRRNRRSQLDLAYPDSPLSGGDRSRGACRPGERAPDIRPAGSKPGLFAALRRGRWVALAFADGAGPAAATAAADAAGARVGASTMVIGTGAPARPARRRFGLSDLEGGLWLVRPDGHIGYSGDLRDAPAAADHLRAHLG